MDVTKEITIVLNDNDCENITAVIGFARQFMNDKKDDERQVWADRLGLCGAVRLGMVQDCMQSLFVVVVPPRREPRNEKH